MGERIFAVGRSIVVSALFVSIWTWFFPRWMAGGPLEPQWNAAGTALMVVGAAIAIRCMWDFAWTGRGTPAPFDPPRRLVVAGPYRWVRNPMYVGLGLFLIGEALCLPTITRPMLIMVAILWLVVTAFIMAYEEPTLRRLFGADYEEYTRHVRRWIPRVKPYAPAPGPAPGLSGS
jgi:protein-S-isoprenylcysteine O-methyltransferase Ste14